MRERKWIYRNVTILFALTITFGFLCLMVYGVRKSVTKPPKQPVDRSAGVEMLESLAHGALLYSVEHGGNEETNFPHNISDMIEAIPPVVANSVEGGAGRPIPYGGYICRMVDSLCPSDFIFEAIPAPGFFGDTLIITKSMKITTKDTNYPIENLSPHDKTISVSTSLIQPSTEKEKKNSGDLLRKNSSTVEAESVKSKNEILNPSSSSPSPPIKDANPTTAREMLQSLYHAALLYSVEHGGNERNNFPTKVHEITDYVPVSIKKAIVLLPEAEEKAIPVDGYIIIMLSPQSTNSADNFCFMAFPAQHFRGSQFKIDKSGNIVEISAEVKNEEK